MLDARLQSRGPRLVTLVILTVLVGVGVWFVAAEPFDPAASAQETAIRNPILTDMTIVALPEGSTPGHVSSGALATLQERIDAILPTVYTGSLLTNKHDQLASYLMQVAANEGLGANIDAAITSLTILTRHDAGTHADLSGHYSAWLTGQHYEAGRLTPDRVEGDYLFDAGLDLVGGRWLVSSWDDHQLGRAGEIRAP